VARYDSSGQPDPTFGSGGRVLTDALPGHEEIHGMALQPDGKILVVGYGWNGSNYDLVLLRFTAAGLPDGDFGTAGKVVLGVTPGSDDFGQAVLVQPDGGIVIAGHTSVGGDYDILLFRFASTGAPDPSFGTSGRVVTPVGSGTLDIGNAVARQNDGKLVVAGGTYGTSGQYDIAVLRFSDTGVLDGDFGIGGKVVTPVGSSSEIADSVAIQQDGRIVVAGYTHTPSDADFVVARYSESGDPDPGFGSGGIATVPVGASNDYCYGMALQLDGKILLAGAISDALGFDFGTVRLTAAGQPDPAFGAGGKVISALSPGNDQGHAVAVHADGRIVVAGEANGASTTSDFAVQVHGLTVPGIAVSQDGPLGDGGAGVAFGTLLAGQTGTAREFTITNTGSGHLANLAAVIDGPDAADFNVGELSATDIPAGPGTANFTVTFHPSSAGAKSATLRIPSNVPGTANPFDVPLAGRALSHDQDSDGDGLNDASEFQMAALGFDWEVSQPSLVTTYYAGANGAGLFTPAQVQALHVPSPLLERDPATGIFTLVITVEKSTTLAPASFELLPMTAPQVTLHDGKLLFRFSSPENAAFFRLSAE
jgi:uncharacterized delta-60 repeat protein